MASACVNNVSVSQELSTYGCFNPRASFSREDDRSFVSAASEMHKQIPPEEESADSQGGAGGFEDPGDEILSDGKLLTNRQHTAEIGEKFEISGSDYKAAPRCSSKWKELLGLKRFSSQSSKAASSTTTTTNQSNPRSSSLKQFLNRRSRSGSFSDTTLLNLPLLKDPDLESLSISSPRDSARLSLDAERLNHNLTANPFAPSRSQNLNPPRMRLVTTTTRDGRSSTRRRRKQAGMSRGVSVDSPRLNSSGKIVFESLERSISSPSSFYNNGGYNNRHNRGVERSYSSSVVRVTPVLNVPVCSIKAGSVIFGHFFSSSSSSSSSSSQQSSRTGFNNRAINRGRNSTDRI